jgi:hypothetical protein
MPRRPLRNLNIQISWILRNEREGIGTGFSSFRAMVGSCEHGNESFNSLTDHRPSITLVTLGPLADHFNCLAAHNSVPAQ